MSEPICLVCNYLPLEGPGLAPWIELESALRTRGVCLVMLSRYAAPQAPFPVFPIPLSFQEFPEWFPVAAAVAGSASTGLDATWARVDLERWGGKHSFDSTAAGIPTGRAVLAAIVEQLKPACVLVWDDATPVSNCLQQICLERRVPVQVMERGLLPGTLMIEPQGIGSRSGVRSNWLCRELDAGPDVAAAFEAAKEYYLAKRPQKYAQPGFGLGAAGLREQLGLQGRRIVMHFGHIDPGFCGSTTTALGRGASPVYESSLAALRALKRVVQEMENTSLIFKPHPHDHTDYSSEENAGLIILREANIHALISLADVIVAQFTTIQFETVFYGKPVLLLARSQWWGRGATYEVNQADDLAGSLEAALARRDWVAKESSARAFIVWMLRRFLIAWDEGTPAAAGIPALADFLATWASDATGLRTAEARIRGLIDVLRQLGRDYSQHLPHFFGRKTMWLTDKLAEAQRVRGRLDQVALWEVKVGDSPTCQALLLQPAAALVFVVPTGCSGRLLTAIAMHPDMWEKAESGACEFTLRVDGRVAFAMAIDPLKMPGDRRWHEVALDIPASATGRHQITLETKGIGSDNFRWSLWREPLFTWLEAPTTLSLTLPALATVAADSR